MVDLTLLHGGAVLDEAGRIERYLAGQLRIDDAVARRISTGLHTEVALPERLLQSVGAVTGAMFELRSGIPCLRSDPLARRVLQVVDPDILMVADPRLALPDDEPFDWSAISSAHAEQARRLLARESIESHVHLGGMLPPSYYWLRLVSGKVPFNGLKQLHSAGWADGDTWILAVSEAAWNRMWLVAQLRRVRGRDTWPHLPDPDAAVWRPFGEHSRPPLSTLALRDHLAGIMRATTANGCWPAHTDVLRVPHAGAHAASGERRLIHELMRVVQASAVHGAARIGAESLVQRFLAYLRVRNAFYQALIHRDGSPGLTRFVAAFDRRSLGWKGRGGKKTGQRLRRMRRENLHQEQERINAALADQLGAPFCDGVDDGGSRRIELRVSMERGPLAVRTFHAWLSGIAAHLNARTHRGQVPEHQVGLVIHFLKRRDPKKTAAIAIEDAHALKRVLLDYPRLRRYVVGVDSAGPERGSAPRLFGEAYRILRRLCEEERAPLTEPPIRLGFTYHVGEDVWDLLTGCRHIDEAASLLVGAGGRLGHALAAGDPPSQFYARRGLVEVPLGEHLLDIVWAWGRCRKARRANDSEWLENRFLEVIAAADLKTPSDAMDACWTAMELREDRLPAEIATDEQLLELIALDHRKSGQMWGVEADPMWISVVATVQALLRERLASHDICIEANPTSNLMLGGYGGYDSLPYAAFDEARLAVSINTDDPGLFTTSIPLEIQYLYQARVLHTSPHEAMAWLEQRLEDARRHSFLGPGTPSGEHARRELSRELPEVVRYRRRSGRGHE